MTSRVKQYRALELPEIISGMLVLGIVLWEACFEPKAEDEVSLRLFKEGIHLILCGLVWFNTLCVLTHCVARIVRRCTPSRYLCCQLFLGLLSSFVFSGGVWNFLPDFAYWVSLLLALIMGLFSVMNTVSYVRESRRSLQQGKRRKWSPAVVFFSTMITFVLVSALVLSTPGAAAKPISFVDAFFTCASAASITGLTCIDISSTLNPLGKLVVLADFQVGAMGVMTFTYFVLLMLGRRLNMGDSTTLSSLLDQEGAQVIPMLLKAVFGVTACVELAGAALLYYVWQGNPAVPQDHLWFYAIFHSVSAFCNAGITLFPEGMAQTGIVSDYACQAVMLSLVMAGTLGFGVYLEGITRLKNKLTHKVVPPRWSTHSWLVIRVSGIVLVAGFIGLALLCWLEPSQHAHSWGFNVLWESLWNTVGRSAGFNLTDLSEYGPVYHIYMCVLMFVGGNPAGTGGGVFAPVVALCVLEIIRVLRGQQDVQIHQRRIARNTVERAMATVVLSIFWIIVTTMILLLAESDISRSEGGIIRMLFLEVSAYTTTGYSLISPAELSDFSKMLITVNMLFGRMGMFTFMLLFIKPKPPQAFRYPETRLPLN